MHIECHIPSCDALMSGFGKSFYCLLFNLAAGALEFPLSTPQWRFGWQQSCDNVKTFGENLKKYMVVFFNTLKKMY